MNERQAVGGPWCSLRAAGRQGRGVVFNERQPSATNLAPLAAAQRG